MKNVLPETRMGWLEGLTIILFFFVVYYLPPFFLYGRVQKAYYNGYSLTAPSQLLNSKLMFDLQTPKYISNFLQREVIISVRNDDAERNLALLVQATMNKESVTLPIQVEKISTEFEQDSVNLIDLGAIPKNGTVTKQFWIRTPTYLTDTTKIALSFLVSIDMAAPQALRFNEQDINQGETCECPYPSGCICVTNESTKTVEQSLVQTILLPPWSNGLLITLALIVAWGFEWIWEKKKVSPSWERLGVSVASSVLILWMLCALVVLRLLSWTGIKEQILEGSWFHWGVIVAFVAMLFSCYRLRQKDEQESEDADNNFEVNTLLINLIQSVGQVADIFSRYVNFREEQQYTIQNEANVAGAQEVNIVDEEMENVRDWKKLNGKIYGWANSLNQSSFIELLEEIYDGKESLDGLDANIFSIWLRENSKKLFRANPLALYLKQQGKQDLLNAILFELQKNSATAAEWRLYHLLPYMEYETLGGILDEIRDLTGLWKGHKDEDFGGVSEEFGKEFKAIVSADWNVIISDFNNKKGFEWRLDEIPMQFNIPLRDRLNQINRQNIPRPEKSDEGEPEVGRL